MKNNICIIGLGYVGLPLCLAFSKRNKVIGYDIDSERVNTLKKSIDINNDLELFERKLLKSKNIVFTDNPNELINANIFIITVPTPIDKKKNPDFKPLISATKTVSKYIKKGDVVIYESTVYPGATEEVCLPIIENLSKLILNKDFYLGYSPERLSPGDKEHGLKKIIKITSGSSPKALKIIDDLYKSIISKGTYPVRSIKIAEAAKVIENTQRDLNIALVNELSIIFKKLKIDTQEVLNAASTKWNFHYYKPGLVGGHCIGVDPYYLTYKARKVGINPKIILAGRKLNDSMARYVANIIEKKLSKKSRILIAGCTFKEDCPDIRNSKIFDLYKFLSKKQRVVDIFDPMANKIDVKKEYGLKIFNKLPKLSYEVIVIAVPHKIFDKDFFPKIKKINKDQTLIFDLKSTLKINESFFRL